MRRIRTLITAVLLSLGTALALAVPAQAQATWWQPGPLQSWEWNLSGWPINTSYNVQVYDLDWNAEEAGTQAQLTTVVAGLHARSIKAICYVDTGTWENYRPDKAAYATAWLGKTVSGYSNERWVNVRQVNESDTGPTGLTLRQVLDARFAQCQAEGFDAVEMDNIDAYGEPTGFPITMAQTETAYETLATDVHNLGMAWFEKNGINGDSFVSDLFAQPAISAPDGTINEQCWQYKECAELTVVVAAGKPILNAEYKGQQATDCPKALAFPMATAQFPLSLSGTVKWKCWA